MMSRLAIALSLFLLGGCAGATPSASPSQSPAGFGLTAWISQALPPIGAFQSGGAVFAIDQGKLIVHGPQIEIFPGPLLPNLVGRPISQAGIDAITLN